MYPYRASQTYSKDDELMANEINTPPNNNDNEMQNQIVNETRFQPGQPGIPQHRPPSFPPPRRPSDMHDIMPPDHRDQGRGRDRKPEGPPPSFVPSKGPSLFAVDAGAINRCLYSYTYIWLDNGSSFWLYPVFVGPRSVAGYRWSWHGWIYTGVDLRSIESFFCTP